MINLDNLSELQKLDVSGVGSSIDSLPDQIKQAWNEVMAIKLSSDYTKTKNIVLAGMGGSALGGRTSQYLFADQLRGPLEVCTQYKLPHYINHETLVILYSYSGSTEETLSTAYQALDLGAQIFVVATGGPLHDFMKENNLSGYIFKPDFNPSNQPRMSLGYSLATIMALLTKCGFISISDDVIDDVIKSTQKFVGDFCARVPKDQNLAKKLALKLQERIPVLVSSEHLWGVTHAVKNQFNENAKTFTVSFDIPELNHHLMEGLQFPSVAHNVATFVLFSSHLYHERVQKRYKITKEVIEKNKYQITVYDLQSKTKLEQAFELLTIGSYVGYYLALLNGIDPAPIPWVDYFKEKMK